MFRVPEQYRIMGSRGELCGAFEAPFEGRRLRIIASSGEGWVEHGMAPPPWEHVSVSLSSRCPNWREMCHVKGLFWSDEDCVIQFHPPRSQYVNNHPHCLHLWRPVGISIPAPPLLAVGIQTLGTLEPTP